MLTKRKLTAREMGMADALGCQVHRRSGGGRDGVLDSGLPWLVRAPEGGGAAAGGDVVAMAIKGEGAYCWWWWRL